MKLTSLSAVVLCLVSGPVVFAQNSFSELATVTLYQLEHKPVKEARRLFEKAAKELNKANYQGGLQLLQKAEAIDPNYWEVQNDIGFAYLQLSQHERAEAAFQRAINIDPANAIGYANMGVSALSLHDYKLAEKAATVALRYEPALAQAKALLGFVKIEQGQWTDDTRRLLEASRSYMPCVDKILGVWPHAGATPPNVVIVTAALHPAAPRYE